MSTDKVTWVVYLMTIHKRADKIMAVCEQSEWDAMESTRPGYHQLVRGGILSESEAELIARGPAKSPKAGHAEVLNFAADSSAV
jgi:hypothetical protein